MGLRVDARAFDQQLREFTRIHRMPQPVTLRKVASALAQAGMDAARRILALVEGLTADDLVICLISFFIFHVLINVSMQIGLLPVTGIPLPLISYGGSATISTLAALGLVQSVTLRRRVVELEDRTSAALGTITRRAQA
mgnify:CR=1 FL=1